MASIGIFDSGSGGLSVFREIRKLLPEERFIYYSDNANCPYGEKTFEFIVERCREITELLISKGAEVIVIACNTATGAAIATLREEYDIPFIGMEPAVKPAALGTESGVIGVLATAGALKSSKYLHTRGQYEDEVRIVEHVGEGFVALVESLELSGPHAEEVVRASLLPLLREGADRIVLGCTHYPFLQPVMEKVAAEDGGGKMPQFIDPAPAVARQLLRTLREKGISESDPEPGVELLASGSSETLQTLYSII